MIKSEMKRARKSHAKPSSAMESSSATDCLCPDWLELWRREPLRTWSEAPASSILGSIPFFELERGLWQESRINTYSGQEVWQLGAANEAPQVGNDLKRLPVTSGVTSPSSPGFLRISDERKTKKT